MKSVSLLCCVLFFGVLVAAGCSGSSDQTEKTALPPPSTTTNKQAAGASLPASADTVNVAVQNAQKPSYESSDRPKTPLVPSAIVKYSVQIGAYKLQDNAEVVASLAKSRFAKNVHTVLDAATGLYKVMVGDFAVKDEARIFRDRMVQQYPGDYKDAWVSELAQ